MYSRSQLLQHLADYETKYGKIPTQREIRKFGITDDPYRRVFGSYSAAVMEYASSNERLNSEPVLSTKKSNLLEKLGSSLSATELKTIVESVGGFTAKPKTKHIPYETGYAKFLVVSDTHIGHSKFRSDWWHHMVERADNEGVQFALHVGDILEGMSNRPGHVYELEAVGFERQFDMACELINECPFPVKAITGNHDNWYMGKADQGINVGLRLESALDNFFYLGHDEADIVIQNAKVKLWHGSDGASYAISYRGQKIVESLDGGDKPHILITGHDHKAVFFQTRNVHILGAGTLCEQTGFMRGKKLAAHRGYWIVEIWTNEEGLVRIRPEWCPFY